MLLWILGFFKKVIFKLLLVSFFLSSGAVASVREDAIKSGFLYNFARYSHGEWFNSTLKPIYNICSFNPQFIKVARSTLKDMSIKSRPVVITLLMQQGKYVTECDTLFISKGDTDKWNDLIAKGLLSKVMLVGEFEGFLASGGHINFFIVGGKIRFEIDPVKLKQSNINMSSKVLRLGRINH